MHFCQENLLPKLRVFISELMSLLDGVARMFSLTPMYAAARVRTLALSVELDRARDLWRTKLLCHGSSPKFKRFEIARTFGRPSNTKKSLNRGCRTPALKTDRTCFQYFRFCFVPGSEIYRSRKKHLFFRFERIFFVLGDKF